MYGKVREHGLILNIYVSIECEIVLFFLSTHSPTYMYATLRAQAQIRL